MEDGDEVMELHTGRVPFAAYPPLPPLLPDSDLLMTQETRLRTAVRQGGQGDDTRQQVEALAQHAAAAHQHTAEQIGQVRQQQDSLAAQTSDYLRGQHEQQVTLRLQQEELQRQMEEHRQFIEEQYRLLKAAQEAVGLQGQRIESLAEAVQPQAQARWEAFAQGAAAGVTMQPPEAPIVTVAAGTNMPVAPLYRGSSKSEKREFMDSYMVYERRIRALNQGTQARIFVMPLSACIAHEVLTRICETELFRLETEVTEAEWREYFLSARQPDPMAFKKLDDAMSALKVDTELPDAESRLSRLMHDFYAVLYKLNMEDLVQHDPKKVVSYLVAALRPPAFKASIQDQLTQARFKPKKASMHAFLRWIRPELEGFMKYEAHLSSAPQPRGGGKSHQLGNGPGGNGNQKNGGGKKPLPSQPGASGAAGTKPRAGPQRGKSNLPRSGDAPARGCFKCGDQAHRVFQCPEIANALEAKELYEQRTGRKVVKPVGAIAVPRETSGGTRTLACRVMDTITTNVTPDTGAEVSIVTPKLVAQLENAGVWLAYQQLPPTAAVAGISDTPTRVEKKGKLDLRFTTSGGPLLLRNVVCWVTASELPLGMGDLLLSRLVMERLGYSSAGLLQNAQQAQHTYDMGSIDDDARGVPGVLAYAGTAEALQPAEEELALHEEEENACFPPSLDKTTAEQEVMAVLMEKVVEARNLGASREYVNQLTQILKDYVDVFRLTIGSDPPVDMPPMEITLKPGAVPTRCRSRRYSQEHREFMRAHVGQLIAAGLCYRNPKSRWCSPPLIIRKPGIRQYRMTVDVRAANECVEPVAWPMPHLEVEFDRLRGSSRYFSVDFFKGFYQFAVAQQCQEIYSILTEEGVITPTRVLMGGTNSVAYVQATVQEMFEEVFNKGLLIWIDDLLGYESTDEGLLQLLKKVLGICAEKGLKLNPGKCAFYLREALWCGRIVSGEGVRHDPARIEALRSLPAPTTGQELQQFICALNWMRIALPAYNKLTAPLTKLMEKVYEQGGGRKKTQVRKVLLTDAGWGPEEEACLERCKLALGNALQLAHPDPAKQLCVFTDASDSHWGAAITQIPRDQAARPLEDQEHEPLMMLSGTFSGSACRWAIVEKEAYAIIETCRRADYLLQRPDGFALFTDHRNLRYIFDPHSVSSAVPKYTADKLHRWSLLLMAYRYEINDIAGDDNVWADLLSRWGSAFKTVCAIQSLQMPLSPQLDGEFVWPTMGEIAKAQSSGTPNNAMQQSDEDRVWRDAESRIWIPDSASSLQLRICVVGHFGAAGHRRVQATLTSIQQRFTWTDLEKDVRFFVKRCLHCASSMGGPPIPRPLGEALHADKPNELIHWDYLYMGKSSDNLEYVLVIKDDASKFVWLLPCDAANADNTYHHLLDWFASFGVCRTWVSDQGTHFKNKVIEALQHALGAHHHFTPARCPWANGTVEVVMREVLRCCRALLSEWRLQPGDWPRVIKIVQMILNHSPSPSLGGEAPVTAMTGLRAMNPLDQLAVPGEIKSTTRAEVEASQKGNIAKLKQALDEMHRRTKSTNKAVRAAGKKARNAKRGTAMAQFDIGDYVLYADVWHHTRAKLKVKWCGPAQVTATSSNWIFEIQNLITGERREAHASRLKFYADRDFDVTEELLRHVAHNSEGHVVDKLLDARYNAKEKQHELKVRWRGLNEAEDSWEPADILLQDVPVAVKAFTRQHHRSGPVKALAKALGLA